VSECVLGASLKDKKGIWNFFVTYYKGLGVLVWNKITTQRGGGFGTTKLVMIT